MPPEQAEMPPEQAELVTVALAMLLEGAAQALAAVQTAAAATSGSSALRCALVVLSPDDDEAMRGARATCVDRQDRQRVAVVEAFRAGAGPRVLVLAREHLAEFGSDPVVRRVLALTSAQR